MKKVVLCVTCSPRIPDEAIAKNILSGLSAAGESLPDKLIFTSVFSKEIEEYATSTEQLLSRVTTFLRQIDRSQPNWVEDWNAVFGLWNPEEKNYQGVPFQSIAEIAKKKNQS